MLCDQHAIVCSKMKAYVKYRHDRVVRYLVKHISRKKRANIVSLKAGNMPKNRVDKREPDIYFKLRGIEYVIDVTFCKDQSRLAAAYQEKVSKYSIIGADGLPLY
jgi:hypothetical protein